MNTYLYFNHNLFTAAGGSLIGNHSSKRLPLNFRKFQSQRGRDAILMSMRHWLAGVLAKERPTLFRQLPESFKVGHPLPAHTLTRLRHPLPSDGRGTSPHSGPLPRAERENHRPRFVHGCELLPA